MNSKTYINHKVDKVQPMVYIIMPCFNSEKYILEQLMSIYYQYYKNWCLIIVNDGSTDSTCDIVRDFVANYKLKDKVRLVSKVNWWVNSAITIWLEKVKKMCDIYSSDNLITYCDSDDVWTRNKLKILVEYMTQHNNCDLLYHDLSVIDENWVIKYPSYWNLLPCNDSFFTVSQCRNFPTSTQMVFRAEYIDKIIPLPTWSWMYQDIWTAHIISLFGGVINYIPEKLAFYRSGHASLLSTDGSNFDYNCLKYLQFLLEKFPDKRCDISAAIVLNESIIRWSNTSSPFVYLMTFLRYPKVFRLKLRRYLYKILKRHFIT